MSLWSRLNRNKGKRLLVRLIVLSLLTWAGVAYAEHKPKDADCLACHSDATLTTEDNGKQASLYVDQAKLKHSIHGDLFACVDCHSDVKGQIGRAHV